MTSPLNPKPPRMAPEPPVGSLCIFIRNEPYSLMVLKPEGEARFQARLTKVGGKSYIVTVDKDGRFHCECGDFHFRREHADRGDCKHGDSVRATGLSNLIWRD